VREIENHVNVSKRRLKIGEKTHRHVLMAQTCCKSPATSTMEERPSEYTRSRTLEQKLEQLQKRVSMVKLRHSTDLFTKTLMGTKPRTDRGKSRSSLIASA
jgi:hypothetical protein